MSRVLSVLIIEDEPTLARAMHSKFKRVGFDVSIAKNGEVALRLLGRKKRDIIILDIMMPLLSGYEVLERIKSQPNPPIVIVSTNLEQDRDKRLAVELGADAFLPKSNTSLRELVEVINSFA